MASDAPLRSFDVIICGGGLAGLTLARQVRRELPTLTVACIEKSRRPLKHAAHKVGESSVELSSQYFERLGLRSYLHENQLLKFGLRFFPGGGHMPLEKRTEIGAANEPVVLSYQLDRGRFEEDLRGMLDEAGVHLVEGASVKDVDIDPATQHRVHIERDGEELTYGARWVIDATGRNALFRRKLKLKRGSPHTANASWFRIEGKMDVSTFVPPGDNTWRDVPHWEKRWLSTVHLMGDGYWVWIIPLSSGNTSIGVVVHDEFHKFEEIRTLERTLEWIEKHEPLMHEKLKGWKVLDFLCLHGYSHNVARSWSSERWGIVGEAGAFIDPLYSPGSDFIAFANSFSCELMRVDMIAGGDLETRVRELNLQYKALVAGGLEVFRIAGPVYGHARAMAAKVYWDNFNYWSFPCQYFLQELYRLTGPEHDAFSALGARFVELSSYVQLLLREWALAAPELPSGGFYGLPQYPSLLVDAHLNLQKKMTPAETLAYMTSQLAGAETIVAELLLRVVVELGPERGQELMDKMGVKDWNVKLPKERIEAEPLTGLGRRHALAPIVRDIERNLGPARRHPNSLEAVALLPVAPA